MSATAHAHKVAPARLCWMTVRHSRVGKVKHKLRYSVYALLTDIDRLDEPSLPSLFAHNRFNLFSLFDRDHGAKKRDEGLRPWLERTLDEAGADFTPGTVRLLCFPRVLGHVFNPISVWFIADQTGTPRATLYEVRNTFGEWHNYLFWSRGALDRRHGVDKGFYVSPFLDMLGGYRFMTEHPPLAMTEQDQITVAMNRRDGDGPVLHAVQSGTSEPLTNGAILRAFFARPLMTLKVVIGIHVEALQLFFKGAKFHQRPRTVQDGKPAKETTAIEVAEWEAQKLAVTAKPSPATARQSPIDLAASPAEPHAYLRPGLGA